MGAGLRKDDAEFFRAVAAAVPAGSQLEALNLLTTLGGRLSTETLRPIYTTATTNYPHMYTNYIFEQWLSFLVTAQLIKIDDSDAVITPAGKTIIPYMQGWGYLNIRPVG
jgi:hypothetical protein